MDDSDRPNVTLRRRLLSLYPEASGRRLKQWLAGGRVRVNGVVVRRGDLPVRRDDRIELGRPAAAFPAPLRLVHEDEHLLVVEKPAGLLTIATETERTRTAYRLLRDWVSAQGSGRIFVVHRLDRETSGLLVFARSWTVKQALQAQFAARTAERVYVARVDGVVRAQEGELTSRLVEDRALRIRPVRDGPLGARGRPVRDRSEPRRDPARDGHGKEAITRYRVLERYRGSTLLELTLVTGRRGQIRVQLAAIGHPVVGDREYGGGSGVLGRVCLHATRLGFVHPSGRRVSFESAPPPGFRRPSP